MSSELLVSGIPVLVILVGGLAGAGVLVYRRGHKRGGVFCFALALALLVVLAPNIFPVHAVRASNMNRCVNNLRQIDGAKELWAQELKKNPTDTPTWDDLVGTNKYLPARPFCGDNGTYTPGNVRTKPTCSVAGHSLL